MTRQRRGLSVAGVRLTRRGWAFAAASLALFIAAYGSGRQELLFIATLVGALPVVAIVFVRVRRPRLAVTRSFSPHVAAVGAPLVVTLLISNRAASASVPVEWMDALPWSGVTSAEGALPQLQPRGPRFARGNTVALSYEVVPPRRGVVSIGPLSIHLDDAFGMASGEIVVGETQSIVVTPEVTPLAATGLTTPAGDGEARLVQRRSAGDADDIMTREYRDGDALRRVHWRATARKGELMVRQEEQRSLPEARVLVDTRRAGYRDVSTDDSDARDEPDSAAFEWVVRMLASVTVHLRRAGFDVVVAESGHPQLDDAGGRRRGAHDEEFLVGLASLTLESPTRAESPGPVSRPPGLGPIVAILGSPEHETVDWMLHQRRPGEVAVAFLVRSSSAIDTISRQFGVPSTVSATAERLVEAGWLVVPVRADDDHAAAWEAVVMETGRSRGTA